MASVARFAFAVCADRAEDKPFYIALFADMRFVRELGRGVRVILLFHELACERIGGDDL